MGSPKSHHTIETFMEASNNEINEKIAHIKPPKYSNLSKGKQKVNRKKMILQLPMPIKEEQ